ncbi:class I SAM-dependent methyltransferase [Rhodophyticola sp. CCM32]|uniref:class I SAM-dependent methyltransferase n=1 Tax=Rhodophyticola sp. CCM32 TaxID=2916397 RepID=UPI00107EF92E|nr:class I SAM-dependent methyltransferase [Rhodophyticola sp. CCM32]QBY02239.1 class I SAM-dependent methyltransferase [Rhodophyticola sp. CCM32]
MPSTSQAVIHHALSAYFCEFDAEALLKGFQDVDQVPEPGLIRNFLGTRIAPFVCPQVLTPLAGQVEPIPAPGNWHADIAEWAAALKSVTLAEDMYRIVELGCGWGCWMTNMGVAARKLDMAVDLIGIEANAHHLARAEKTLNLNGFTSADYRLIHGVAGAAPGKAIFPLHEEEEADWGGEAVFDPDPEALAEAETSDRHQILEIIPLSKVADGQMIDLLHLDIQGAEYAYVEGCFDDILQHVKRVLIGTHSRRIEGQLFAAFQTAGWKLEMERPAIAPPVGGQPRVQIDGVQLWANPVTFGPSA